MYQSIEELPLVGGHPALDLVNTWEPRLPAAEREDHLQSPGDLVDWAVRTGIVDTVEAAAIRREWASSPAAARRALGDAKQLREALDVVLLGLDDLAGVAQDLEFLRSAWVCAAGRSALVPGTDGRAARLVPGTLHPTMIADRLAWHAIGLLGEIDSSGIGVCPAEAGGCGWAFVDRSRNRSRRWCSMGDCGARIKARRLSARRREARATGNT